MIANSAGKCQELPKISGQLFGCGVNIEGQLGMNFAICPQLKTITKIPVSEKIVDIKTGSMHSLCLTESGTVMSFGNNFEGALGRDTSQEGSEAIPTAVELPGKAIKISAGRTHSACLLEDKRVFAWGTFDDNHGFISARPMPIMDDATDIASGRHHLIALTSNGEVFGMGTTPYGQIGPLARTLKIRRVATNISKLWGTPSGCFMEGKDRTIYATGLNNNGQLGLVEDSKFVCNPKPLSTVFFNVKKITGGNNFTLMLTKDKKVFFIGRIEFEDFEKEVETLTPIAALDGVNVLDIDCNDENSFAVSEDGKVYVWGMGLSNQLGTGDDEDVLEPKLLVSAQVKHKKVLKVSGGGQHTLFVVHGEDTSNPEPETKRKKVKETDANDPEPAKKRIGKSKAKGANKVEKTNGNHSDKPEPEPEKTQELEEEETEPNETEGDDCSQGRLSSELIDDLNNDLYFNFIYVNDTYTITTRYFDILIKKIQFNPNILIGCPNLIIMCESKSYLSSFMCYVNYLKKTSKQLQDIVCQLYNHRFDKIACNVLFCLEGDPIFKKLNFIHRSVEKSIFLYITKQGSSRISNIKLIRNLNSGNIYFHVFRRGTLADLFIENRLKFKIFKSNGTTTLVDFLIQDQVSLLVYGETNVFTIKNIVVAFKNDFVELIDPRRKRFLRMQLNNLKNSKSLKKKKIDFSNGINEKILKQEEISIKLIKVYDLLKQLAENFDVKILEAILIEVCNFDKCVFLTNLIIVETFLKLKLLKIPVINEILQIIYDKFNSNEVTFEEIFSKELKIFEEETETMLDSEKKQLLFFNEI